MSNDVNFKALVPLDGQEMQIIIDLQMERANELKEQGKPIEAGLHISIAVKMRDALKKFHNSHFQRFNKIYGFTKEKSQL